MDVSSIDRRTVLQMAAVGGVGLSGCSTVTEESDPEVPRLIELSAVSFDSESHTFECRLELDGETVYRSAKQVDAAGPDDSSGALFEGYPGESKPYVLSAWLDGDESTTRTLEFTSLDAECLGVRIVYGWYRESVENADLAIYTATACRANQ